MDQRKNTENGFNENGFNTVEEALEDLRQRKRRGLYLCGRICNHRKH